MALKPLQQWYCDRCDKVIEKPKDGWLHWRSDGAVGKIHSIEILHHLTASPRGGDRGCYPPEMDLDMHLHDVLGPTGIAHMLSKMDVGIFHDPEGRSVGNVKDIRNWVEIFRRLHIPYYEEARHYFDRARSDGELDGINEVALYLEDTLKRLVDRYGDGDEHHLDS